MSHVILVKIHPGSFEAGFPVTVEIGERGRAPNHAWTDHQLPPAPGLPLAYDRYRKESPGHRSRIIVVDQILNVSQIQDCWEAATVFKNQFLSWLDQPAVLKLQMKIHRLVRPPAQVILQTDDPLLQRLPWELWSLLDEFDFAVSHTSTTVVEPFFQAPVKILAVLGNSDQIDTQADLQWLNKLPQSRVTLLKQPLRQTFNEALWEQPWDVLFFAGHSRESAGGQIELNNEDALSFSELPRGVEQAVQNGLTLAILNSCASMELAQQLGKLQLPYAVVMRELVPDVVAQLFLRYFLSALGAGEPLPRAMRIARGKLHGMEHEFPCASWLPVLCQNAAAPVLHWPQEAEAAPVARRVITRFPLNRLSRFSKGLLVAPAIALGCFGIWAGYPRQSSTRSQAPPTSEQAASAPASLAPNPPAQQNFEDVINVPEGDFRYGGSTTWANIRKVVDPAIQQSFPQFRFDYQHPEGDRTPGTVAGVEMLAEGKIDFLHASRTLKDEQIQELARQGTKLKFIKVAQSFKAVAVHPSLHLRTGALELTQVEDICTGRITNWQDVGGPDLPIQLFDRITQTSSLSTQPSLGDQCQSKRMTVVTTPQQAIHAVAQTPGGFHINTAALLVPQCGVKVLPILTSSGKVIDPYQPGTASGECPASRPKVNLAAFQSPGYRRLTDILYVVVKEDGSPGQRAGEAYAALLKTAEGRSLLQEAGFLPVD